MGGTGHQARGGRDDHRRHASSHRAPRVPGAVPPRLRPTGVVLFATIDDGTTARVVGPHRWSHDSAVRPRARRHVMDTLTSHPAGRRLHEAVTWLLGR